MNDFFMIDTGSDEQMAIAPRQINRVKTGIQNNNSGKGACDKYL